jgi:hypothetical protein
LSYQWKFNGTDLPGATNCFLSLPQIQPTSAGGYSVVVSNLISSTLSHTAIVSVVAAKPSFLKHPVSQTVWRGTNLTFAAVTDGSLPQTFQWHLNGSALNGATDASLSISNVQRANLGAYSVVVSNNYGSECSSNAILTLQWLVSWGYNGAGQVSVPVDLSNVVTIAAGAANGMALRRDGAVAAWGGPNLSTAPNGLTNIVGIATGAGRNFALKDDGSVVGWNSSGLLVVPENLTNIVAVSVGAQHNLALAGDGSLFAWGDSFYGLTNLPLGLTDVVDIACGAYHTLALRSDGTVLAWGLDDTGTLGPLDVPSGLSNVVAIAPGNGYNLALKRDGTVVSWGSQPGAPGPVPADLTNVTAIACGGSHALALKADGTVVAWGENFWGQIDVPVTLSNAIAIAAGGAFSMALVFDGWPDPQLTLSNFHLSNVTFHATFPTVRGRAYVPEFSDLSAAPNWQMLSLVRGSGATNMFLDQHATPPGRLYRIRKHD